MADKYLYLNNGVPTERVGTVSSTGVNEAGDSVALDTNGRLNESVMPTGIGADTIAIVASENLAGGDFVNIFDDGGTPSARKADAATGKEAHGFVLDAVTLGGTATVYFEGNNDSVTGATVGRVFLSAGTSGAFTSTPPTGSGNIVQVVGVATSPTNINVELGQTYVLA